MAPFPSPFRASGSKAKNSQPVIAGYSLLLCGLPKSVELAPSLKWEVGTVPEPRVKKATIPLADHTIITLTHYSAPQDLQAAAIREFTR